MRIGFIGYRHHASRLLRAVDAAAGGSEITIYHPNVERLRSGFAPGGLSASFELTSDWRALMSSDVVFVACPTAFHYEYLARLCDGFPGYVFCEKPPVATATELAALGQFPRSFKDRVHFNFAYRYSAWAQAARAALRQETLGVPIQMAFRSGHGLAFKPEYATHWRNMSTLRLEQLVGNVGIHFVDLALFLLGDVERVQFQSASLAPASRNHDSTLMWLHRKAGLPVSAFLSYSSACEESAVLTCTDGILHMRHGQVTLQAPRDVFASDGLFVPAPLQSVANAGSAQAYYDRAHLESVSSFLELARTKAATTLFDLSLCSTRLTLEAEPV